MHIVPSSAGAVGASNLPLRDYQTEAIAAIARAEREGVNRPLVALPTGTGKTVVFSHLLAARPGRGLVLAHRDELLSQAADKIKRVNPRAGIGLVKAEANQTDAPIVVASAQTLAKTRRLEQLGDFETIIVDEAHHAAAPTYLRILTHLGAFDRTGGPLTVGFTATPERADGIGLSAVWQSIVFRKSMLEMIERRYLADLRAVQVQLRLDLGAVRVRAGDFSESSLSAALVAADAPDHAVAAYQRHASGRKALLFTPTVALAYEMAAAFEDAGISAEALDGSTPADERRAILARLASGETRVLANCAVLTEGFDEPSVDCVIVARPTQSRPLFVQMVGRGTRLYPGKDDCLVLDLVGVTRRHDLVTTASLFGLEDHDMDGRSLTEAVARRSRLTALPSAERTPAPAGQLVAAAVDLFNRRPLHWVPADGRYVLTTGNGYLSLEPSAGGWAVVEHPRGAPARLVARDLELGYAQGYAEDRARASGAAALNDPLAPWRERPASEKQINLLRMRGVPVPPGLTQGRASDLISASFSRGAGR